MSSALAWSTVRSDQSIRNVTFARLDLSPVTALPDSSIFRVSLYSHGRPHPSGIVAIRPHIEVDSYPRFSSGITPSLILSSLHSWGFLLLLPGSPVVLRNPYRLQQGWHHVQEAKEETQIERVRHRDGPVAVGLTGEPLPFVKSIKLIRIRCICILRAYLNYCYQLGLLYSPATRLVDPNK